MCFLAATMGFSQENIPVTQIADTSTYQPTKLPSLSSVLLGDVNQMTPNISTENLITRPKTFHPAFFCRMEDQFANKNKVNLKLRLGSVDYVDYLESKSGSQIKSLGQP